ncbi:MAG: dihydrolipoyl dehydrogenase [Actinomycetota bacterium]
MADEFDLVVLGGGTGGYSAAIRAATLGLKVALVERDKLGGTCLHRGCIPTKALLHSAEVLDSARGAARFGVTTGETTYDWDGVQKHKDRVVTKMHKGLEGLIKHRAIEMVSATGTLRDARTVVAGERELRAARALVLATGSAPKMLPGLSVGPRVLTSDEALTAGVPRSAIVLGGGSVGVEFASMWASFGSTVTIVEMLPSLLPFEEPEVGRELARAFSKRGIRSHTGAKLDDLAVDDDKVSATVSVDGKTETIEAEVLLVAVGRRPVTEGAGLDAAGVAIDERGFIPVNDKFETNVAGVYAVGDAIPTAALAHVAFTEGMTAAEHIAGANSRGVDYRAIARPTYCTPEVGAVGLTEAQAREKGYDVVTVTIPLGAIGKAAILGETAGFCKLVAERDGALLGASYVGPHVTDLVSEAMLAVGWEASVEEIAALIHPHPSMSEMFGEAALALAGRALHTP